MQPSHQQSGEEQIPLFRVTELTPSDIPPKASRGGRSSQYTGLIEEAFRWPNRVFVVDTLHSSSNLASRLVKRHGKARWYWVPRPGAVTFSDQANELKPTGFVATPALRPDLPAIPNDPFPADERLYKEATMLYLDRTHQRPYDKKLLCLKARSVRVQAQEAEGDTSSEALYRTYVWVTEFDGTMIVRAESEPNRVRAIYEEDM